MAFAHLHVHTEYSALDGLTRVSDLFPHIASLGQTAVATTDHGNLAACWAAQQRADATGVKYIAGCLLAGQEIITDRGIKPVEEITAGDQVLTHRGRFRPVLRTMTRRHRGHAYRIHLADRYSRPLILTDEHPILIRDNHGNTEWLKPGEIAAGRANRHGGSESWMSYVCLPKLQSATQILQVSDYLPAGERWSFIGSVLGKRSSVRNRRVRWKKFPAVLDIDHEFAYYMGLFAAEGSFGRHRDGRLTGRMTFDLHRDETAYAQRVAKFAESLGGRVQIRERRTNSLVVDVALLPLAHVMDSLIGSGADSKRVPAQILQAPEPVRESFVEGLVDGDGRSAVPDDSGRRGQFRTTSRDLAWGLRTLLTDRALFLGISESHPAGKRPIYAVSYREGAAYRRTFDDENFVYRPIRAIERFDLDDDVYNFEVQDDNSYVSDFVLHNCEFYLAIGSRFDRNVLWVDSDDNSADEDGARPDEDTATDGEERGEEQRSGADGRKARRYMHLTVLAATPAGWTNLVRLNNLAQESIWQKPRIDFELLAQHAEGLIVLTGCLGGPVLGPLSRRNAAVERMTELEAQLRDDDAKQGTEAALSEEERTQLTNQLIDASADANAACENLEALIGAVGRENVYVELMEHGIPSESEILSDAVALAREYGVGIVATNDSHHTHAEDADAHAAWLLVQSKSTLDNPKYAFHGEGYWLRNEEEMRALRPEDWWQEACDTTQQIADRCAPRTLPTWRNLMPSFETPPGHDSNLSYLFHMLRAGAHRRYGGIDADTQARVRSEVDVIAGAGMVDYFLIVEDLISWARSTRPVAPGGEPKKPILVGPGRGSGGGSEVAYLLNLTQVPPRPNGLLFERFYELGRSEPPDFDIDFPESRRDAVIEYLGHRYGRANVAFLGTFMVDRTKAAIKHAARILSLDALGAKMTDLVPLVSAKPMAPDAMMDPEQPAATEYRRMVENDSNARRIHEYAARFHDVIAGYGIHASGIIVSAVPLADLVPLRRSKRGWVIQWSGTDAEQLGLLKVDVLGLRSLDVVDKAVEYIRESTGEDLDWMSLPDPAATHTGVEASRMSAAWKVMAEGRTAGIFQLESPAMTELAMSVAPNSLNDVSALVALFRPGPMAAGMHETYARRKRGEEPVDYRVFTADPAEQAQIATVLGETYGVICYQEQIMQLGTVVAGMDASERSKLRKAVSKKKKDMMDATRERFVTGAVEEIRDASGAVIKMAFAETTAVTLWDMIVGFAEYAFNRAHSATYGLLSYVTAYLKGNWPTDFAAATLAVTDGDQKRIQILRSLRDEGVEVLPPDVNRSRAETFPERAGAIRFGLSEIKGLNKALGGLIVTERERSGKFESLHDIIRLVNVPRADGDKTTAAAVKSNDIRNLIDSGAVDAFGPRLGQTLTAAAAGLEAFPPPPMEWGVLERATRQRDRLLVSLGEHPLLALADQVDTVTIRASGASQFDRKPVRVEQVPDRPGEIVHVLAVLGAWSERVYSKGRMANLRIDGIDQSIPGTMWDSELAEHNRSPLTRPLVGDIVTVHGKVRYREILTDPRDPDSETVSVKEMQVYSVRKVDVTDPAIGSFPPSPYPRIDFTAPPEAVREPVVYSPPLFVDDEPVAPAEPEPPAPFTAEAPVPSATQSAAVATLEAPPATGVWSIEPGMTAGVPVSAGWAPSAAIANAGALIDRASQRELLAALKAAHAAHQATTYTASRDGDAVLVLQLE
ncbi:DNA polymerase III subunit alpha [Microbacterium maritypicum]|uniref:DNA-directed DNA polymerase n=1 Tax=Microbacterium maritypicum MF109 TaxID=1333857 RepID=T5K4N5_MICMQ|nr:DNA polymerase III subunit alpha [Microbacterium liquefaciens]EQM74851.1 hypothetical protein L687_05170 [Microbacterium maritypicum MF109]